MWKDFIKVYNCGGIPLNSEYKARGLYLSKDFSEGIIYEGAYYRKETVRVSLMSAHSF